MNALRPVHRFGGHLPIADHALIGDGRACALVGRDGVISWMCVPRLDDAPLFAGLLDTRRGGVFRLFSDVVEAEQRYLDDTAVVVTTVRTSTGVCRITDAFLLHRGARLDYAPGPRIGALLRRVEVLSVSSVPFGDAAHAGKSLNRHTSPTRIRFSGQGPSSLPST